MCCFMAGGEVLWELQLLLRLLVGYSVDAQRQILPPIMLRYKVLPSTLPLPPEMTFFTNFGKLKNHPRMLLSPCKSAQSYDTWILTIIATKKEGLSRSQAVRRFMSLERSLTFNGRFNEFEAVLQEYLNMNHAERIPLKETRM